MTEDNDNGLLAALWRYRWTSIAIVLVLITLSYAVATLTATGAQATATIGLRTPRANNVLAPGLQGDASLGRYTAQRSRFVMSDEVMASVGASEGRSDLSSIRGQVRASPSATSNIVTIIAEAETRREARDLAFAVVNAYRHETDRQVREMTEAAVSALDAQIQSILDLSDGDANALPNSAAATLGQLQLQVADLEASRAAFGDGVEFVVEPTDESVTTPGLPLRELALGMLVGLVVAGTVAWIRANRDRRVSSAALAASLLDRPLFAELRPSQIRASTMTDDLWVLPGHDHRLLWTVLWQSVPKGVILTQEIGPSKSSFTAVNLAAAAAREDLRVLVVDANVRAGAVSTMLGYSFGFGGLSDTLQNHDDWHLHVVPVNVPGQYSFTLMPAGARVNEVDVSTARMQSYLDDWRDTYDYVFVDSEILGAGQLATKLAALVDGVLLVVGSGVEEHELLEMRRQADLQGVSIVGFAFVGSGKSRAATKPDNGATAQREPPGLSRLEHQTRGKPPSDVRTRA